MAGMKILRQEYEKIAKSSVYDLGNELIDAWQRGGFIGATKIKGAEIKDEQRLINRLYNIQILCGDIFAANQDATLADESKKLAALLVTQLTELFIQKTSAELKQARECTINDENSDYAVVFTKEEISVLSRAFFHAVMGLKTVIPKVSSKFISDWICELADQEKHFGRGIVSAFLLYTGLGQGNLTLSKLHEVNNKFIELHHVYKCYAGIPRDSVTRFTKSQANTAMLGTKALSDGITSKIIYGTMWPPHGPFSKPFNFR